jgi:hypothetical protein
VVDSNTKISTTGSRGMIATRSGSPPLGRSAYGMST